MASIFGSRVASRSDSHATHIVYPSWAAVIVLRLFGAKGCHIEFVGTLAMLLDHRELAGSQRLSNHCPIAPLIPCGRVVEVLELSTQPYRPTHLTAPQCCREI
jgi:hypothetical protein